MRRQVHPDGVHFEQSTCFHAYTADIYLHFLVLAARNRLEVPPLVAQRLERMLEFVLAIRHARRDRFRRSAIRRRLPAAARRRVRAADRARPVCHCRGAVRSVRISRGPLAARPPDVAWLMGTAGMRAFDAPTPAPPTAAASRAFPSGGYAVMRTGWERDAHQMLVDVGPLGCPVSGAHGHADLLSIQCSVFGDPVIVDPGTHCYGDDRGGATSSAARPHTARSWSMA